MGQRYRRRYTVLKWKELRKRDETGKREKRHSAAQRRRVLLLWPKGEAIFSHVKTGGGSAKAARVPRTP